MHRVIRNLVFYGAVSALSILAVTARAGFGGAALPSHKAPVSHDMLASGPVPPPDPWEVASGPVPPPDPWEVASGPVPPPDPWEVASGPVPPPDPWEVASGPVPPPDPWEVA